MNLPENKIVTANVPPYSIVSVDDASYVIANISGKKFQTRIKYIRNIKRFNLKRYIKRF